MLRRAGRPAFGDAVENFPVEPPEKRREMPGAPGKLRAKPVVYAANLHGYTAFGILTVQINAKL